MEVVNNDLVSGASGRIGDMLVFRQRGGKTFITKRPKKKSVPDSENQLEARARFTEAATYAKSAIEDPGKKAFYQSRANALQSAYNLALADYYKAPEIKSEDLSAYNGQAGDSIIVRAIDNFKVMTVTVEIKDSDDHTVEKGDAIASPNGIDWLYMATTLNPDIAGTKLVISASDLTGNLTTKEVLL
jgi:hypothetical protein